MQATFFTFIKIWGFNKLNRSHIIFIAKKDSEEGLAETVRTAWLFLAHQQIRREQLHRLGLIRCTYLV